MKIPREHIEAFQTFGYTEREARFLCIVAVHSGYFTQRQYTEFGPRKVGCIASGFTNKLVARGHASEHKYQNNTRVLHFTFKPMYCAIGKENIRNRRAHSFEFMKTRLAILDFVLRHPQHDYLEGEAEKVQYFEERFQIRPQDMPGRTYRGANKVPDTIRYFVDKFPLFLDSTLNNEPARDADLYRSRFGESRSLQDSSRRVFFVSGQDRSLCISFCEPRCRAFYGG